MCQAKMILTQCLKGLTEKDYFNVIGFGSSPNRFSPFPLRCTDINRSNALSFKSKMFSTLGYSSSQTNLKF